MCWCVQLRDTNHVYVLVELGHRHGVSVSLPGLASLHDSAHVDTASSSAADHACGAGIAQSRGFSLVRTFPMSLWALRQLSGRGTDAARVQRWCCHAGSAGGAGAGRCELVTERGARPGAVAPHRAALSSRVHAAAPLAAAVAATSPG